MFYCPPSPKMILFGQQIPFQPDLILRFVDTLLLYVLTLFLALRLVETLLLVFPRLLLALRLLGLCVGCLVSFSFVFTLLSILIQHLLAFRLLDAILLVFSICSASLL